MTSPSPTTDTPTDDQRRAEIAETWRRLAVSGALAPDDDEAW